MKFKQYGYKKATVEVRPMSMGAIALTIAQGLISKNLKDIQIRIVDCFSATVETFKNLDEFLTQDWAANWEVNVYAWGIMHDNTTNENYFKVIISDEAEI